MPQLLTKSNFIHFMDCPCRLWIEKNHKELVPPVDVKLQAIFDNGNRVDKMAQELFSGGVTIDGFNFQGYENTKKALASDADILYQPTIVIDGLTCRADILVRNGDGWDLHEVKMGKSIKEENYYDATFQTICFEKAGVKLKKVFITYINGEYLREGEVDIKALFIDEEITEKVRKLKPSVEELIPKAKSVFEWGDKLKPEHLEGCEHKKACEWTALWADTLSKKEREKLFVNLKVEKSASPLHVDKKAIKNELAKLQYPLYFFDYETYMTPIPDFDGQKPWKHVPFQFSVMVVEYEGSTLETHDFLMDIFENPIPPLLEAFEKVMGPSGTVISWYASFEKNRNEEMAEMYPEYAKMLRSVNDRTYDLFDIFKKGMYVDPAFGGSNSLKDVMPVLCPDLSYKNLNIQEGGTASASWKILTDSNLPVKEREKLHRDMIDYCRLDVYGMVKILEKLKQQIK